MPDAAAPSWHSAGEHELPEGTTWLAASERERAASLRFTKRRNDYLLGRFTTKSAVRSAAGLPEGLDTLQRIEVRNLAEGPERGRPELFLDGEPAAFDVSITDRAGWGVCMLHPRGARVGCDLELIEPRSEAFVSDYLTPREQSFVAAGPSEGARFARANLVWSAKESVLKVLGTGLRRDTRSIEVRPSGGPGREDWYALRAVSVEGRRFSGWWCRFGPFLLTLACDQHTPPPRPLVHPQGLVRARPSHRWLDSPLAAEAEPAHGVASQAVG
jgi:4'-phosphopantetheinyl transferase